MFGGDTIFVRVCPGMIVVLVRVGASICSSVFRKGQTESPKSTMTTILTTTTLLRGMVVLFHTQAIQQQRGNILQESERGGR